MSIHCLVFAFLALASLPPPGDAARPQSPPAEANPPSMPPAEKRLTRVVPLKHAYSDEAAPFWSNVFIGELEKQRAMVLADKRTNSIVLRGTEDLPAEMCAFLRTVDVPTASTAEAEFGTWADVSVFELILLCVIDHRAGPQCERSGVPNHRAAVQRSGRLRQTLHTLVGGYDRGGREDHGLRHAPRVSARSAEG